MPRKSAASMAVKPVAEAATATPLPQRPEPPETLPEAARALWRAICKSRPADYFDRANQELLEIYCRAMVENRRVTDALEQLDPATDIDLYAKLVRAADTHAKRAAQMATRLRLAKNSITNALGAGRAAGDHRTPAERMKDRYR